MGWMLRGFPTWLFIFIMLSLRPLSAAEHPPQFSSKSHLQVYGVYPDGTVRELGRTPAKNPVQLPRNLRSWYVAPVDDALTTELVDLLREKDVPGFALQGITDFDAGRLSQASSLSFLRLTGAMLTDAGIQALSTLPLEELAIRGTSFSDEGLSRLAGLKTLRTLDVGNCPQIHGEFLKCFPPTTTIQKLNLESTGVGDTAIRALGKFQSLRVLILDGTEVTDKGVSYLSKAKGLRRLSLRRTVVSGEAFGALRDLPKLSELNLSGRTTDKGLSALKVLDDLKVLSLNGHSVTTAGIANIGQISSLRELDISLSSVDDAALSSLGSLEIKKLYLSACPNVTNAFLLSLPDHHEGLKELKISRSNAITDESLANLKDLQSLRRLSLAGCSKISDAAVPHLSKIATLRELEIAGTQITVEGAKRLRETLRDCDVSW